MPIATASPASHCRGYILAHQHPNAPPRDPNTPIDPYDVVPCPHPTEVPAVLSEKCAESPKRNGCGRGAYCTMHFCGGCKKALRGAEILKGLKKVEVVQQTTTTAVTVSTPGM